MAMTESSMGSVVTTVGSVVSMEMSLGGDSLKTSTGCSRSVAMSTGSFGSIAKAMGSVGYAQGVYSVGHMVRSVGSNVCGFFGIYGDGLGVYRDGCCVRGDDREVGKDHRDGFGVYGFPYQKFFEVRCCKSKVLCLTDSFRPSGLIL